MARGRHRHQRKPAAVERRTFVRPPVAAHPRPPVEPPPAPPVLSPAESLRLAEAAGARANSADPTDPPLFHPHRYIDPRSNRYVGCGCVRAANVNAAELRRVA